MAARSDRMYKDSPALKRDGEGKMGISKPSEADAEDEQVAGPADNRAGEAEMPIQVHQAHERHELHHRHINEHLQMHRRHEMEHMTHKGEPKEIHKKHEAEHKEMQERHHEELKSMHRRHEKGASSGGSEPGGAKEESKIEGTK